MLAEQNVQLKEALKRLHSHSIAEKTDVSVLASPSPLPSLSACSGEHVENVYTHIPWKFPGLRCSYLTAARRTTGILSGTPVEFVNHLPQVIRPSLYPAFYTAQGYTGKSTCLAVIWLTVLGNLDVASRLATLSSPRLFDHWRRRQSRVPRCKTRWTSCARGRTVRHLRSRI